jgi:hypothetical protein
LKKPVNTGAVNAAQSAFVLISLKRQLASQGRAMAKKRRVTRHPWTKQDEQELRRHSKNKSPLKTIAQSMKRTPGALRQKAFSLGLPLGHRRSSKRKKSR